MNSQEDWADYYLSLLEEANANRTTPEEGDMEQVRRVWEWALKQEDLLDTTLAFMWVGVPILERQDKWLETIAWLKEGVRVAQKLGEKHDAASIYSRIASNYYNLSEREFAQEAYLNALVIFEELNDLECKPKVLNGLGLIAQAEGHSIEALNYYEQALELFKLSSDLDGQASVLNNIGEVHTQAQRYKQALGFFEQAVELYKTLPDKNKLGLMLCNVAVVRRHLLDSVPSAERPLLLNQIAQEYQEALTNFEETNERYYQAVVLSNLSELYQYNDWEGEKVEACANQAKKLFEEIEASEFAVNVVANLATYYDNKGDQRKALKYDKEALATFLKLEQPISVGTVYNNIAYRYLNSEDFIEALLYVRNALSVFKAAQHLPGQAMSLERLGWIYLLQHKYKAARKFLNLALALYRELDDAYSEARVLNQLGMSYAYCGEFLQALEVYQEALKLAEALGDEAHQKTILRNMARHDLTSDS